MCNRQLSAGALALGLGVTCSVAIAQPWAVERLGFYDADHSRSSDNGYQESTIIAATRGGWVSGSSRRYIEFGNDGGNSAWVYHPTMGTRRTGLFDAAHVRQNGYQRSSVTCLNNSGVAAGFSERYAGLTLSGQSAWYYNPASGVSADITLRDPLHTDSGGYQSSSALALNASGIVVGSSFQYGGGTQAGQTAWAYDPVDGHELMGLVDAEHTAPGGFTTNTPSRINDAEQIVGTAGRYSPSGGSLGISAWVHTLGSGSVRVGLYDADHTSAAGVISNQVRGLSDAGMVLGTAPRYRGGTSAANNSVWLGDPSGATSRLGYFNAEHTASDGTQQSDAFSLTSSGFVAGRSRRFDGAPANVRGWSAWVYRPDAGYRTVGLRDAEHTRLNGSRISEFAAINNSGQVVGTSNRYTTSPDTQVGVSAFFDDAATGSVRIGLVDAEHTRSDQFRTVDSLTLTDGGLASGRSQRFAGSSARGWSAWAYRQDIGTRRLGLTDGLFTHPDGSRDSSIVATSDDGFVIGTSTIYVSFSDQNGKHGWFHDLLSNTTYDITVPGAPTDLIWVQPQILTPSGLVLGHYRTYGFGGELVDASAFLWSVGGGTVDLDSLVQGGFPSDGLAGLRDVVSVSDYNTIVGYAGLAPVPGTGVYALVPAPGGAALLGLAGLVVGRRRR